MNNRVTSPVVASASICLAALFALAVQASALSPRDVRYSSRRIGASLYSRNCARCHGATADGKDAAPSLKAPGLTSEHIISVATNGIPTLMPAFKSKLNGRQLESVAAYVKSLK
jgi:mono/diheme cytochrome c family protein